MGTGQQPEEHQQHACALCQEVIALRAREATIAAETLPDLFGRCSECGHQRGRHTPDCSEARQFERAELRIPLELGCDLAGAVNSLENQGNERTQAFRQSKPLAVPQP